MGPIKLIPIYDKTIWAGSRLAEIRGRRPAGEGTAWEISVHPHAQSVIAEGEYAGKTLASLIETDREGILGNGVLDEELLRAAFLDAETALSVQVHPGERYAKEHSNDHGKTESWYILAAKEGADLVCGSDFKNREEIKAAIEQGTIESHLTHIPVKEGDFILVPSGTLHSLGAGILALEIGTNSNTTYRFYDYGRKDKDGNLRELHIENSLDVVVCGRSGKKISTPYDGKARIRRVADFPEYAVDLIDVCGEMKLPEHPDTFRTLSCVKGDAVLEENGTRVKLNYTESVFLPASCGDITVHGTCRLLVGTPKRRHVMEIKRAPYYTDFSRCSNAAVITFGRKKLKDIASYYKNTEGVDLETVLYEVQCDEGDPSVPGSLSYGLTTIYPVLINGECAFTKGHWHMDETCEEIYEGESGNGLLMYMDHEGHTWCETVEPGSVHHIRGDLAHRLINTGEVPLKVRAVWPPCAGHNYDAVAAQPFGYRVMKQKGEIEVIPYERL